jgi:hypothetical protein
MRSTDIHLYPPIYGIIIIIFYLEVLYRVPGKFKLQIAYYALVSKGCRVVPPLWGPHVVVRGGGLVACPLRLSSV